MTLAGAFTKWKGRRCACVEHIHPGHDRLRVNFAVTSKLELLNRLANHEDEA
jgi:hypothetical protein